MAKVEKAADDFLSRPTKECIEAFQKTRPDIWDELMEATRHNKYLEPWPSAELAAFLNGDARRSYQGWPGVPVTEFYLLAEVRHLKERLWKDWSERDQVMARCLKKLLTEDSDLWHRAGVYGTSESKFARVNLDLTVFTSVNAGIKDYRTMSNTVTRLRDFAELAHVGFRSEVEEIANWPK